MLLFLIMLKDVGGSGMVIDRYLRKPFNKYECINKIGIVTMFELCEVVDDHIENSDDNSPDIKKSTVDTSTSKVQLYVTKAGRHIKKPSKHNF
ncbi:hypothetical protein FQA39_LY09700 [Lamprigera yunnana]|nr:hypothetical protein FQA39_LY09700 [Lamprigera yunnana]